MNSKWDKHNSNTAWGWNISKFNVKNCVYIFYLWSEKRQSSRFMMMMMIPVVVFVCASMFNKEKKSYKESCIFFIHFLSEKRIFLLTFRINTTPRGKSKLKYEKMKQRRTVSNLKCFHILLHLYCFHFFFVGITQLTYLPSLFTSVYILWEVSLLWITQTFTVKYLNYIKLFWIRTFSLVTDSRVYTMQNTLKMVKICQHCVYLILPQNVPYGKMHHLTM